MIGRTADTTGLDFVDLDFGEGVRKSLAHLAELGHRTVALFNFPPDQLEAGYNSALIARRAFEEATAELGIRGIDLPCPHPAAEAFGVAHRPPSLGARVHGGDHDRVAVHGPAHGPARGRHARPRRLLDRLGDRGPVRGDAHARADRDRVAGVRGRQARGRDADRPAQRRHVTAASAPGRRRPRCSRLDRAGTPSRPPAELRLQLVFDPRKEKTPQ